KLRNELLKYINENTPSGDIHPYLKKLEEEVDKYAKDENPEPSEALRREFDERLWKLVKSAPKEGRNFARIANYIMKFDGEWFAFLQHKDTEPTSNRAERALRPMVIKRRI
ncbi:MAG: transposase, partial [Candidatus Marsarchaeota archaeon]|nr:transposase [Candidatus Marsarchaeota archaeon]